MVGVGAAKNKLFNGHCGRNLAKIAHLPVNLNKMEEKVESFPLASFVYGCYGNTQQMLPGSFSNCGLQFWFVEFAGSKTMILELLWNAWLLV